MKPTRDQIRRYYEKRVGRLPLRASESGEVSVPCLFHNDRHPSQNINLNTGLWYCHAENIGGNMVQFEMRLKKCDYLTALKAVSDITGCDLQPARRDGWELESIHPYCDADGNLLYEVLRFRDQGGAKQIRQRKLTADGDYSYRLDEGGAIARVLYNLQDVIRASDILIVEGEKDADLVRKLDWAAQQGYKEGWLAVTTNPGGAGKWLDQFSPFMTGKNVSIFRDNDPPGIEHADNVAHRIHPYANRIKIICPPAHDVGDWINSGATAADLIKRMKETPLWKPREADADGLRVVSAAELLAIEVPPREMILAPILPTQGLAMLYSKRGVGKTYVGLGIAHAVATGGEFLRWKAPMPRSVLYIDGELPQATLRGRVQEICGNDVPENLKFITPDLQQESIPDLSIVEGQMQIERHLKDFDLIILDNLSALCRTGKENESESWQAMQEFMLRLRRKGKSVLLIHHAGKGGTQRGTSRREDLLDSVINLRYSDDYSPEDGLRCEVHYEKARGFYGKDAQPFEVRMRTENSSASWSIHKVENTILQQAGELFEAKWSVSEVAEELDISRSRAGRLRQKWQESKPATVPASQPEGLGQWDNSGGLLPPTQLGIDVVEEPL